MYSISTRREPDSTLCWWHNSWALHRWSNLYVIIICYNTRPSFLLPVMPEICGVHLVENRHDNTTEVSHTVEITASSYDKHSSHKRQRCSDLTNLWFRHSTKIEFLATFGFAHGRAFLGILKMRYDGVLIDIASGTNSQFSARRERAKIYLARRLPTWSLVKTPPSKMYRVSQILLTSLLTILGAFQCTVHNIRSNSSTTCACLSFCYVS